MICTRRTLLASTALIALGFASPALAESEGERLKKRGKSERYERLTDRSKIKAGCAKIAVKAQPDVVEKVAKDFKNYARFISKFKKARVVGKEGDSTLVYLSVPILHGAANIWAVVKFGPTRTEGDSRVIEGRMTEGNVKRLDALWRITPIDDEYTQLDCELLIEPKIPAPGSVVTGEVAYAADEAVTGAAKRAVSQQRKADRKKKRKAK